MVQICRFTTCQITQLCSISGCFHGSTATMTWVLRSNALCGARPIRSSLAESRAVLEALGVAVLESEIRSDLPAHRICPIDWRRRAKAILTAGFIPSPDNDSDAGSHGPAP